MSILFSCGIFFSKSTPPVSAMFTSSQLHLYQILCNPRSQLHVCITTRLHFLPSFFLVFCQVLGNEFVGEFKFPETFRFVVRCRLSDDGLLPWAANLAYVALYFNPSFKFLTNKYDPILFISAVTQRDPRSRRTDINSDSLQDIETLGGEKEK